MSRHGVNYPSLRTMYTLFRIIECSSAESERQFSINHRIMSPLRNALGKDSLWSCMRIADCDFDSLPDRAAEEVAAFFMSGQHPWTQRARKPTLVSDTLSSSTEAKIKVRRAIWD